MSRIAVLGLGAMGSRMAANLIAAGYAVTVWNRSATATEPLLRSGATCAHTPRDAATGAEVVIAMIRDDDASRYFWLDPDIGALGAMAPGALAIESSTLTPGWIRELGKHAALQGVAMLEAPVSGSRIQAEATQLIYLVGGDETTLERARPVLETMGSSIHHLGPLGQGALVKLSTNALLGIQVAALAEIVGLLKRNGIDPGKALSAVADTSVWPPVAGYLANTMLTGNFSPQFPVELIAKDFDYTLEAAGLAALAPTISTVRDVFHRALAHGLGQENMTSVVKLVLE